MSNRRDGILDAEEMIESMRPKLGFEMSAVENRSESIADGGVGTFDRAMVARVAKEKEKVPRSVAKAGSANART